MHTVLSPFNPETHQMKIFSKHYDSVEGSAVFIVLYKSCWLGFTHVFTSPYKIQYSPWLGPRELFLVGPGYKILLMFSAAWFSIQHSPLPL